MVYCFLSEVSFCQSPGFCLSTMVVGWCCDYCHNFMSLDMQMTDLCLMVVQFASSAWATFDIDSRGSPWYMTWCITDGVTTCHTISDNAVSEKEKIWRIRAEDIDEKGVRMRQNNSEVNCFSHIWYGIILNGSRRGSNSCPIASAISSVPLQTRLSCQYEGCQFYLIQHLKLTIIVMRSGKYAFDAM